MRTPTPLLACLSLLAGCLSTGGTTDAMADRDTHSFARPEQVRTTHLDLDLMLDFDQKVATGVVTHRIERLDRSAPFVVDTSELDIRGVTDQSGAALAFELGEQVDEWTGKPLTITLADDTERVQIRYATSPLAEAMQWLSPEQTSGKEKPFLFTQGQAILTRSWIPLQDSPAVRVTWTARVTAPDDMVSVMSAEFRKRRGNVTRFTMSHPVPPYLIALACGDLVALPVSGRCAVWAEPDVVEKASRELSDLERMIRGCEQLFGPYRWGRYDVLFLPPSFPFGGMENPCMTFATPTILAGDKSLVALIAHELAHSWSGNLVTNATWRDFWLNEGFTVYLEQRIMEHVYGSERAKMEIKLGMQGLRKELQQLPAADQVLHIDLTGRNPDDGMTAIAYDKGAAFLRRLEEVFGRERLDAFLREWFDEHAFQSVTTATFVAFLQERLLDQDDELAAQVDVDRWIRSDGLPENAPEPESAMFAAVDRASERLAQGALPRELDTDGWVTQQWLRFLSGLQGVDVATLAALDEEFEFTRSGNSEVLCAWLALATRRGYHAVDRRMELFLMTVGRRKFLMPLYRAMLEADGGKERALGVYRRARGRYHPISQRSLDELLGYEG